MSRISVLLDECESAHPKIAILRRDPSIVIARIGDPGMPALGTKDPEVLEFMETSGMVLLTNNRKSMPRHVADHLAMGRHHPGIFRIRPGTSLRDLVDAIYLLWAASDAEEWIDRFEWLPF